MSYIKEHKSETILLGLIIVLLIVFIGIFLALWYEGSGDKYGSRLLGIEDVPITEKVLNNISSEIKENEVVAEVSSNIQGRIINYIITVNEGTNVETAKSLASIVKKGFTDEELAYYDIQVFLTEKDSKEDSTYPYIGYKHKNSEDFSWSNN